MGRSGANLPNLSRHDIYNPTFALLYQIKDLTQSRAIIKQEQAVYEAHHRAVFVSVNAPTLLGVAHRRHHFTPPEQHQHQFRASST
ncbi:hypothetical protein HYQ44_009793 [Verticillium longisporum]|nr:hypothetical protein HYQ44_009793 [Verticillium longisporum]